MSFLCTRVLHAHPAANSLSVPFLDEEHCNYLSMLFCMAKGEGVAQIMFYTHALPA